MNILFLIGTYSNFGGTERITTVLANAFAREGQQVHIAAFRETCAPAKFGLDASVECHELEDNPVASLHAILVSHKIDVIINQWCLPFYVTRIINKARRGLPVRLISALHGVPDRSKIVIVAEDSIRMSQGLRKVMNRVKLWVLQKVIRFSIRYVYKHSDAYVVLSKGFLKTFSDYTGLLKCDKLFAIGNPITVETDYSRDCVPEKKRQILYVGRMDKENKRVNRIVEAWENVWKDYPDWELVLVGGGPHLDDLKDYVAKRQIERVSFKGFVKEDPIKYYKDAAIFMLTSDLEGFGLVLVEAMSYGVVPIVYGSYVSVYDIIDSGVNGLITSTPYSQGKTTAALKSLMDNEILRQKMARAAKEKSKDFAIESVVLKWEELLRSI